MKTSRLSPQNHWRNVGNAARMMNIPLERVLTKNNTVNVWIKEGYNKKVQTKA